ncbi:nuclear transport factor 2 family protein [uncultured Jatrophihabitans sp.]|uniref:nuclear transport factor 2 family protein n=1 Tax=uncultured Jatrophihabitans sp. TaxID=1610747 RepID=UPI0035CB8A0E
MTETLHTLTAKSQIGEAIARYGHYADHQDWDAILDLFADDAVFDTSTVYGRQWRGKAELREFYEGARIAVAHHVTPPVIDVADEATAQAQAKMLVFWRRQVFSVDYVWTFVAQDGRWLIAHQSIEIVGRAEFDVASRSSPDSAASGGR